MVAKAGNIREPQLLLSPVAPRGKADDLGYVALCAAPSSQPPKKAVVKDRAS